MFRPSQTRINGGAPIRQFLCPDRLSGSTGWTLLEVEGWCPEGAERVSVEFHMEAEDGTAYFDDAGLAIR